MTETRAIVLYNEFLVDEDEEYWIEQRLKKVKSILHLLKKTLKFKDVSLYVGLSKWQIIEKFKLLQLEVEQFERKNKKDNDLLLIAIIAIGRYTSKEKEEPNQGELARDESRYFQRYYITKRRNDEN